MNITNVTVGQIIKDPAGISWEVEAVYPHYVRAKRLWDGEEHNCEQYKCFDIGLLVTYGYEDGGDPRTADTEKEERYGKPRC